MSGMAVSALTILLGTIVGLAIAYLMPEHDHDTKRRR
jgi:hypothetical protein